MDVGDGSGWSVPPPFPPPKDIGERFARLFWPSSGEDGLYAGNALTVPFRSASPFWRSRASDRRLDPSPKKQGRDHGLVVGASYSHADMLKFDNLYASSHLYPR